MSEPVRGVVVAHADLAEALVHCVEGIAGVEGALVAISNNGVGPSELERRVEGAVGASDAVIFVDLASGSCALAAQTAARTSGRVAVVTGVNLPMLLDFVFHRDMELGALVRRLIEKALAGTKAHVEETNPGAPRGEP